MDYNLKLVINNTEIYESDDPNATTPFIDNVVLKDSTAAASMQIGATASNVLYFTLFNPYQVSFDGAKVDFYISAQNDTTPEEISEIIEQVGDETVDDGIDDNDIDALEDDTDEGEDLTEEEETDAETVEGENVTSEYEFFNGEVDAIEAETTEEEEEPDWVQIGSYWVYSQNNSTSDNSINFVCYDGMSKLNGMYTPSMTTGTVQEYYNDFRSKALADCGVIVDEHEFSETDNITIKWNIPTTFRQAIGYLAGVVGGYATFGNDDTLGISWYAFSDSILIDTNVLNYNETSSGEFVFGGLVCDRSTNPYKDDVIEIGAGQSIKFANPFVTSELLSSIYDYYKGIRYVGAEISAVWDDTLRAGEFVRIMSPDEYANYIMLNNALDIETDPDEIDALKDQLNGLGKVVLISNQTVNFKGEAISSIISACDSEYKAENKAQSPSDATFKNLYAEMIEAEYLRAKGAFIADLTAENLKVDSINGKVIKNSAVLAKALSGEMIETYLGVKVFYQADEPTAENVGDIWYLTVAGQDYDPMTDVIKTWDGTAWVEQQFDTPRSIFMANSIIAQDINTNSLATNQAFIDKLFAQSIEATNFNLKGGSINISTEYSGYDYIALRYLLSARGEYYRMAVDPQRMEFVVDSTNLSGGLEVNPFGMIVQNSSPDSMRIGHSELNYGANGLQYSVWGELSKVADLGAIVFEETGSGARVRVTAKDGLYINNHTTPIGTVTTTSGTKSSLANGTTSVAISTKWELPAGSWIVLGNVRFSSLSGHRCHLHMDFNGVAQAVANQTVGSEAAAALEVTAAYSSDSAFEVQLQGWQNKGSAMSDVDWYMRAIRIA